MNEVSSSLWVVLAFDEDSFKRICFNMPASKSSTLSFIATEVSTNLHPYLSAIFLASIQNLIRS